MKTRADLVKGWLLKAESDLTTARLCLAAERSFDTACFHAQQAAEKCLKAYLIAFEIDFPFVHNLEKLIDLCAQHNSSFSSIRTLGQELTPYAVELRYDAEFWPSAEVTHQAIESSVTIKNLVMERLPADMKP